MKDRVLTSVLISVAVAIIAAMVYLNQRGGGQAPTAATGAPPAPVVTEAPTAPSAASQDAEPMAIAAGAGSEAVSTPDAQTPAIDPSKARLILSGTVRHAAGGPAGNAEVTVSHLGEMTSFADLKEIGHSSVKTSADGTYKITVEDSMLHFVRVRAEGCAVEAAMVQNPDWHSQVLAGLQPSGARTAVQDFILGRAERVSGIVLDGAGEPVSTASLSISPVASSPEAIWKNFTERQTTTTGLDGRFEFADVKAGQMIVVATAENYLPIEREITSPDEAVELRLSGGGTWLSGFVYRYGNNEPLSSATVTLIRNQDAGAAQARSIEMLLPRSVTSDSNGAYKIGPLREGNYQVQASKDKLGIFSTDGPLTVTAGDTFLTRDIYLYPGHVVFGRVTEKESGAPIEGVEVSVGHPNFMSGKATYPASDITDAQGRYRVSGVLFSMGPGSQVPINVLKEGYTEPAAANAWERSTVTLSSSELETERDLQLVRSLTVSGTVRYPDGKPVRSGTVSFESESSHRGNQGVKQLNSDGGFVIDVKPMSSGAVRVNVSGYPETYSGLIEIAFEQVDGIEVRLDHPGSISGVVVDDKGNAVADAAVQAQYSARIGKNMTRGVTAGKSQTDRTGRFSINNVPPGEVNLTASKEGYADSSRESYTLKPAEHRTDARLALRVPHFVAGVVVDGSDKPIASAGVSVSTNSGFWRNAQTDAKGFFRIESVPEVSLRLYVNAAGESQSFADVRLDDESQKFVFGTEPSATLIGTVVDRKTRAPITNYTVAKLKGSGGGEPTKDSAAPHTFRWDKLKPNWFLALEITAPGYAVLRTEDINVVAGKTIIEKTFELGTGGSLVGRIVDQDTRQPIEGARVMLLRDTRLISDQIEILLVQQTSSEGRFQFDKVSSPRARLRVVAPTPYAEKILEASIKDEETTDLGDIEVNGGNTLTVYTVDGATGAPVANVPVELYRGPSYVGQKVGEGSTGVDGKFIFTGVNEQDHYLVMPEQGMYASYQKTPGNREIKLRVGTSTLKARVLRGGKPFDSRISMSFSADGVSYNERGSVSPDAEGRSEFQPLIGGTWTLTIVRSNDWQNARRYQVQIPHNGVLERTFNLPMGEIAGRVLNEKREPVAGAAVLLSSSDVKTESANRTTQTNGRGEFRLVDLDAGAYNIDAHHQELGHAKEAVTLGEDEKIESLELILRKGGGTLISSAFRYDNGEPLQQAWVKITRGDGSSVEVNNLRESDGVMKINFIPPGTYDVEVSYWGYSINNHKVQIREGEETNIEDVLYRAGALRWTINLPSGSTEAEYTITPEDPQSIERVRTGRVRAGAQVVERGLWPGNYRGAIAFGDGRTVTESIEILEGELTQKETVIP